MSLTPAGRNRCSAVAQRGGLQNHVHRNVFLCRLETSLDYSYPGRCLRAEPMESHQHHDDGRLPAKRARKTPHLKARSAITRIRSGLHMCSVNGWPLTSLNSRDPNKAADKRGPSVLGYMFSRLVCNFTQMRHSYVRRVTQPFSPRTEVAQLT